MTQRNARLLSTIFLLISAPFLLFAVRGFLNEAYASMCLDMFMALCMIAAAAEPEFLTRKVSEVLAIRSTADGQFDELTELGGFAELCLMIATISLLGWVVFRFF